MNWILIFIIVFMFIFCGMFDADSERLVLAEDIESGKLIPTSTATRFINKGDTLLWESCAHKRSSSNHWVSKEEMFKAFIAKVMYERARLEMEMQK